MEITMQNKTSSADTSFFSQHPCSSIEKGHVSACHQHVGYVKGDILLDIIKEGLLEKRGVINGYHSPYSTLQILEFNHAEHDEGTWNLGRALCRPVSRSVPSPPVKGERR
jgi:hypothetical protein